MATKGPEGAAPVLRLLRGVPGAIGAALLLMVLWLASHSSEVGVVFGRYSWGWFCLLLALLALALVLLASQFQRLAPMLHAARDSLGLLIVSGVLSLAALEAAIRTLDAGGISYYEEAERYRLDMLADEALVHRHRADFVTTYHGVPFQTNALGLHERTLAAKAVGERRLLFLGDSVTLGWGVAAEQSFVRQVETHLHAAGLPQLRSINSGVGGYNSEQELAFLRRHGDALAPDLVLLVYVENDHEINEPPFDPRGALSLAGKSPPQVLRLLVERSWTWRSLLHFNRFGRAALASGVERGSPGWQRSLRAVQAMAQHCTERGIPFALLMYEHVPNGRTRAAREDLARIAAARGLPFTSSEPWLAAPDPRALSLSPMDPHLNPDGHARLARGLAAWLRELPAVAGWR